MSDNTPLRTDATERIEDVTASIKQRGVAEGHAAAGKLRKSTANKTDNLADAVEAAAAQFDGDSLQAQAAHHVADRIETVAHRIRTTDLNTAVAETRAFARRNPLLFFGGAAMLGFAATRFLKASEPQDVTRANAADPWARTSIDRGQSDGTA